jgi:hypothetical protein
MCVQDGEKATAARDAHFTGASAYLLSRKIDGHFIEPGYENDDSI